MSYTQQNIEPGRRAVAVAGVIAAHAVIGLGVITGLTVVGVIDPVPEKFIGVEIPLPPAPKPTEVPSQQASPPTTTVTAPVPPLPIPTSTGVEVIESRDSGDDLGLIPSTFPPGPVATTRPEVPRPLATYTPRLARPANDRSGWVTSDDYPSIDLRREFEGVVRYRVTVGSSGRVTACEVLASSGSTRLDDAACRNISRRARFEPATSETGETVVGTFTGTVSWEIPD